MKHLKEYKLFESFGNIEAILKRYRIRNYVINKDGTVDVNGFVDLNTKGLTEMPVKFGYVSDNFHCDGNELTSLEGCPKRVGGYFDCSHNKLTSLEGCPVEVNLNFYCEYNKLVTLEGSPESVGGEFNCSHNKLISLKGCPKSVGSDFDCFCNEIVKLDFIPDYVGGNFDIGDNPLDPRFIGSSNWDILELDVVQGNIRSIKYMKK